MGFASRRQYDKNSVVMRIEGIIWLRNVIDKLAFKHRVAENDSQKLPSFASLDELVEFFDSNDMGEYEENLPEAHFEVDLQRKTHLIAINEEINNRLTEIAEQERTPAESLVNSWLKEKISRYPKQA